MGTISEEMQQGKNVPLFMTSWIPQKLDPYGQYTKGKTEGPLTFGTDGMDEREGQ